LAQFFDCTGSQQRFITIIKDSDNQSAQGKLRTPKAFPEFSIFLSPTQTRYFMWLPSAETVDIRITGRACCIEGKTLSDKPLHDRGTDFNCRYTVSVRAASRADYPSIADFLVLKT